MGMESYLFKADEPNKDYYGNHLLYLRRSTIVHNWMVHNAGWTGYNEEVSVAEDQLRSLETYCLQRLVNQQDLECWHVYELRETIAALWTVLDPGYNYGGPLDPAGQDDDHPTYVYRAD